MLYIQYQIKKKNYSAFRSI